MALKYERTDDPTSPSTSAPIRRLERLLSRHASEGFDVLELRRHMGKRGYVRAHRWEDDGYGNDLTDDDGSIILIGGVSPANLASDIVETARQHVEETGERKAYRLVALRRIEGVGVHEEEEEVFDFLLPATMFAEVGVAPILAPTSTRHEYHDTLMASYVQLQQQNDALFRVLMEVIGQYPTILRKSTELLEQLGDQLGGGRQHDLQQVLSILDHESTREQRLLEHELIKQRSSQRAAMFGKSIDIAGPDLMVLVRKVIEMAIEVTQQQRAPEAAEAEPAANESSGAEAENDERT